MGDSRSPPSMILTGLALLVPMHLACGLAGQQLPLLERAFAMWYRFSSQYRKLFARSSTAHMIELVPWLIIDRHEFVS